MKPVLPMIPVSAVSLPLRAHELVGQVLASGQLAQGPMVLEFERLVAERCGVTEAIAVTNGTASLELALKALGIGPGDEVVTSPFTFVATLNAIIGSGATAVFADIDLNRFTIDSEAAADAIGAATAAVMPVHLYGQAADMSPLMSLASRNGFAVVEDAAQALGATVDGTKVGSFGVGSFSFYATKNVTTGEGGALTTNDTEVAQRIRLLRNQGMRARYEYAEPGHNMRMTDLAAAVGIPQMEELDQITARRAANASQLTEGLAHLEGLVLPSVADGCTHVWHQYTVRVTADAPRSRDEVMAGLAERGIGSGIYYPRVVFDYDCFRSHPQVAVSPVPNAQQAAEQVVSLPVHPGLSESDLDRVVTAMNQVWRD